MLPSTSQQVRALCSWLLLPLAHKKDSTIIAVINKEIISRLLFTAEKNAHDLPASIPNNQPYQITDGSLARAL